MKQYKPEKTKQNQKKSEDEGKTRAAQSLNDTQIESQKVGLYYTSAKTKKSA